VDFGSFGLILAEKPHDQRSLIPRATQAADWILRDQKGVAEEA
jgi:hypothetical protein